MNKCSNAYPEELKLTKPNWLKESVFVFISDCSESCSYLSRYEMSLSL